MPSISQISRIKGKLRSLPKGFDDFLSAGLPVSICWSSLKDYGFEKSAEQELVPIIHIADGSLVALWFSVDPPPVVLVDAHGEPPAVVAIDFPNFLRSLSASKTGIPDFDEDCTGMAIEGYTSRPTKAGIAALQRRLDRWAQSKSSLQPPHESHDGETLRKRIHAIAKRMIRDGKSKVYSKKSTWWSMGFRIQRERDGFTIQYLDYGQWYGPPQ